ncbi:MAG: insulinase family protein [Ignavibacteriales bacterium]|nr:insulinase family protein [Ignavibacteriales bacterium]
MKQKFLIYISCIMLGLSVSFAQLSVKYEKFTLPNGLTVILHEDHSIPVATCNIWYHVGSGNEKPGRAGFAHLFEHLMFEGSKNVPEGKFDEWLEAAGGDNNGSTSSDRTNYWENFPNSALELALFLEEDKVQLPRLYINWLTPEHFSPGDAELDILANVLAGGKNSRLYKRLVYDLQIAQDVTTYQDASMLNSTFSIITTARSGHSLTELEKVIREEINKIKNEAPTIREVQRAVNQFESSFLMRMERVGGFGGKADLLNAYYVETGNPDYFNEDLARYKALTPEDVQSVAQTYLRDDGDVVLSIVPQGKKELAAEKGEKQQ